MLSAESLGFLGDELDCREFVVKQFQCGILAQPFRFLSTSMRMWTRSMDYNTGLIRVHRYFCNTSATGVKMRLCVQVLTGGWTDDSFLYIYMWHASLLDTSLDFDCLWMGNAA